MPVAAIRTCKTRETLEDMLERFEITGEREGIECLNECMYDPEIFFSTKPSSIEDEFEFTKQIFLTGTWRLNEYYERMGIRGQTRAVAEWREKLSLKFLPLRKKNRPPGKRDKLRENNDIDWKFMVRPDGRLLWWYNQDSYIDVRGW
jgi:hypothetical protein